MFASAQVRQLKMSIESKDRYACWALTPELHTYGPLFFIGISQVIGRSAIARMSAKTSLLKAPMLARH